MARVTVEDCVEKVPNRFQLVLLAAHRARLIRQGSPLTIDRDRDKDPVVALREIADETIDLETVRDAPETGNFAGDQARDIDSIRLQNRTRFSFGGGQVDAGVFLNTKSLYHPIFQVVDQESVDRGVYARLGYASGPNVAG